MLSRRLLKTAWENVEIDPYVREGGTEVKADVSGLDCECRVYFYHY